VKLETVNVCSKSSNAVKQCKLTGTPPANPAAAETVVRNEAGVDLTTNTMMRVMMPGPQE
jgi:hypothetical protein